MKRIALLIPVLALSGCASTTTTEFKHHDPVLSVATAERTCRTAMGNEWTSRTSYSQPDVITSLQGIDVDPAYPAGIAWEVDGTVHYTLISAFVNPIIDTVDLTCLVTGTNETPVTSVTNRR
jgi:uncharacterized protein YceK